MEPKILNQRYELQEEVGRGGMGIIYRAYDAVLERIVAVKILSQSNLGTAGRARLLTEARSAARLNHPNIVSIFDAGEADGVPFIVMEMVEGRSLFRQRPQEIDEIIRVFRQICAALDHAHQHSIIHRDLKPENVILTASGQAKLMDFGLARSIASRVSGEQAISGTVFYLAPELALGQDYDARADLYSLGVMLYEMVAGRLPFIGEDILSVISQHINAPVVPPHTFRPNLPNSLEAIILKLMAKRPEERFETAADVNRVLASVPASAHPSREVEVQEEPESQIAMVEQLASGRLVGRREELAQLSDLWQHVLQGHGHMALVSGEPGVGKTRVSRELVVLAQLNGAVVLSGGCYEYESTTPYLPFVEALREWVHDQPAETLRTKLDSLATVLSRLAPEIETKIGPLPPSSVLPPNEERLRLFDTVARFFQRLSAEHGLLLFIDDLHWADQGTLNLLHYILRSLRSERLMVLAAYREMELDRTHPLASALVEWNRERLALRIQLNRLTQSDVQDLLAALFGQVSEVTHYSQAIYKETEGNPFFIEEVVKSQIEQGQICRSNCQWQLCDPSTMSIPQSIKEAVGRRLSRQSDTCLDVLHLASVLGKRFIFSELSAICLHSEDQVLDALDEAASAQLIQATGEEEYSFTHDKIREVLYEELNSIRRRRLHQRVGEGLEAMYRNDLEPHIPDLAHHFIESGDLKKGMQYSIRAAEQAEWIYAHAEAIHYYQRALEAAEILGQAREQAQIYNALGHIHYVYDSSDQSVEAFEKALALAETEEEQASLEYHIGMAYAYIGDSRGLPHLLTALDHLNPETQASDLAHATALIGRYHHYQGEWEQAAEAMNRAREIAEEKNDPFALTDIYAYLSGLYQQQGRWEESIHWAQQCIDLGQRTNSLVTEALGYEFLAEYCFATGQWRKALEYAEIDRKLAEKAGSMMRKAWAEAAFEHAYFGLGNLVMALAAAAAGCTLAEQIGDQRLSVFIRSQRGIIHACLGNLEAAEEDLGFALTRARKSGQRQLYSWALPSLVTYHYFLEEYETVLVLLDEWDRVLDFPPDYWRFHVYYRQGRMKEAGELLAWNRSIVENTTLPEVDQANFSLSIAEYYAALGEPAQAEPYYQKALELFRKTESRLWEANTLFSFGKFLRSTHREAEAQESFHQAHHLYLECGSPWFTAQVEKELGRQSTVPTAD